MECILFWIFKFDFLLESTSYTSWLKVKVIFCICWIDWLDYEELFEKGMEIIDLKWNIWCCICKLFNCCKNGIIPVNTWINKAYVQSQLGQDHLCRFPHVRYSCFIIQGGGSTWRMLISPFHHMLINKDSHYLEFLMATEVTHPLFRSRSRLVCLQAFPWLT